MKCELKINGHSRAVGISLLLHCLVLLGLGVGTLPGSAPRPNTMAVYLAIPSVEVFSNPKVEILADDPTNPEPTSLSSLELNGQGLKIDRAQIGIEATSAVELDENNSTLEETKVEALSPKESAESEPEPLLVAEIDYASDTEELGVRNKPQALIDTSAPYNPIGIINSSEDRVDTDHRSPITDHQSSLLAFAGDPAALGMLARDALGPDLVQAQILFLPEPAYPVLCRKRGEEGRVVIEIEISAKGKVLKAQVANSSSYARLDRAAQNAVKKASFSPAMEFGRPVESQRTVAYVFRLEGK